jgi:hypothetical protein
MGTCHAATMVALSLPTTPFSASFLHFRLAISFTIHRVYVYGIACYKPTHHVDTKLLNRYYYGMVIAF